MRSRFLPLSRIRARITYGFFAEDFIEPLVSQIDSPVVFEFGAHRGEDTRRICRWLRGEYQYFAWEPDPRNFEELREVIRQLPRVTLVEAAVGDRDATLPFHLSSGEKGETLSANTASSSLLRPTHRMARQVPRLRFDQQIHVPVRTLDSFCHDHSLVRIDLIWADIQGAEKQLVTGGSHAIANTRYLFLEQSPFPVYEGAWTFQEMLRTLGERWAIVQTFPDDVLLYNREIVAYRDLPKWRRFLRACFRELT